MGRFLTVFLFTLLQAGAFSQSRIRVWPSELDFGTLSEQESDSLPFYISNGSAESLRITLSIPFRVWQTAPFRLKDSVFVLPPSARDTVWVFCRIGHNVLNRAAVLVCTDTEGHTGVPLGPWFRVGLRCQGRYSLSYYDSTQNLSEEPLRLALRSLLAQGYTGLSYDVARDKMYGSIDNRNDSVTCVYTSRKARFNTRQGATANNFNCEHTFPQGLFGQALPMRSDLHHLFPTDENANNSRGDLPFGVALPPFVDAAINAPSRKGGGVYEPQDLHKGAVARALFYFVVRYQDYGNFLMLRDSVLRVWHRRFPPGVRDSVRNQAVFVGQGNRNPFIDYPRFEERIRNLTGPGTVPVSPKLRWGRQFGGPGNPLAGSGDTLQFLFWNEGQAPAPLQNLRIRPGNCLFFAPVLPGPVVDANSAFQLSFPVCNPGDTLYFETASPEPQTVAIPLSDGAASVAGVAAGSPFRASVVPNPLAGGSGTLLLSGPPGEGSLLEVSDLAGRVVFRMALGAIPVRYAFQPARLAPGAYRARVSTREGCHSFPLLIP